MIGIRRFRRRHDVSEAVGKGSLNHHRIADLQHAVTPWRHIDDLGHLECNAGRRTRHDAQSHGIDLLTVLPHWMGARDNGDGVVRCNLWYGQVDVHHPVLDPNHPLLHVACAVRIELGRHRHLFRELERERWVAEEERHGVVNRRRDEVALGVLCANRDRCLPPRFHFVGDAQAQAIDGADLDQDRPRRPDRWIAGQRSLDDIASRRGERRGPNRRRTLCASCRSPKNSATGERP